MLFSWADTACKQIIAFRVEVQSEETKGCRVMALKVTVLCAKAWSGQGLTPARASGRSLSQGELTPVLSLKCSRNWYSASCFNISRLIRRIKAASNETILQINLSENVLNYNLKSQNLANRAKIDMSVKYGEKRKNYYYKGLLKRMCEDQNDSRYWKWNELLSVLSHSVRNSGAVSFVSGIHQTTKSTKEALKLLIL